MNVTSNHRKFARMATTASATSAGFRPSTACRRPSSEQSVTGPMLAASGATLPRGHLLLEPYLYDVTTVAVFNDRGRFHARDIGTLGAQLEHPPSWVSSLARDWAASLD